MITNIVQLKLSDGYVAIRGEHYVVSNGFATKTHGEVRLWLNELLSIELIRHRSKKAMYVMLLPTGILAFTLNFDSTLSMIPTIFLAVIICIVGLVYLLSARQFVEFTTMQGTYRIAVEHSDTEIEDSVTQMQQRIINSK